MVKKSIVIGIVCILMLVSIPSVMSSQTSSDSSTKITMADQFIIRCSSPYIFAGFNLEYFHDIPETEPQVQFDFTVEKLDGTIIYDYPFDYLNDTVPPRYSVTTCEGIFKELMTSKIFFGIFAIKTDLHVLDDDSHQYRTFFGVYIFPHLKVIYLGQLPNLILPWADED